MHSFEGRCRFDEELGGEEGGKWETAPTLSFLEKFLHVPLTVFKNKVLQLGGDIPIFDLTR